MFPLVVKGAQHGCCWETFYIFACSGLVGNPHLAAKISICAPLPTSTKPKVKPFCAHCLGGVSDSKGPWRCTSNPFRSHLWSGWLPGVISTPPTKYPGPGPQTEARTRLALLGFQGRVNCLSYPSLVHCQVCCASSLLLGLFGFPRHFPWVQVGTCLVGSAPDRSQLPAPSSGGRE